MYTVFLLIDTALEKAPLSQTVSFPTVFTDFQAALLQLHVSILCNMVVYGDIKISVAMLRLCFLEKLCSTSAMFSLCNLGTK